MPLLSLGLFCFSIRTTPFAELKRTTRQRWESKNRVSDAPAWQYVGPGDDAIVLSGTLAPELTGGPEHIQTLRTMADSGKAWILTGGNGENLGRWFIQDVQETWTSITRDGYARKITFEMNLTRYRDNDPAAFGDLKASLS